MRFDMPYKEQGLTLSVTLFDSDGTDMRGLGFDAADDVELIPRDRSYAAVREGVAEWQGWDDKAWQVAGRHPSQSSDVGDVVVKHTRNAGKTQKQLPNAGKYTLCVRVAECPHLVFVRELISASSALNTKLFEVRASSQRHRPHLTVLSLGRPRSWPFVTPWTAP